MSADFQDLYQQIILDHNKRPRNRGKLEEADRSGSGYNPTCGDEVAVWLKLDGDVIDQVRFSGEGCAISQASASLLTLEVGGKSLEAAETRCQELIAALTGEQEPDDPLGTLGDLAALTGVRQFPARIKCATLAWHALLAAIEDKDEQVQP
ncbi:MAG: Fe-S cluster assembly sulfur transfer protein SufU [Opitutales bacterium]